MKANLYLCSVFVIVLSLLVFSSYFYFVAYVLICILCQIIPGIELDNGMKAEWYRCSICQSLFYLFC